MLDASCHLDVVTTPPDFDHVIIVSILSDDFAWPAGRTVCKPNKPKIKHLRIKNSKQLKRNKLRTKKEVAKGASLERGIDERVFEYVYKLNMCKILLHAHAKGKYAIYSRMQLQKFISLFCLY